MFAAPPVRLWLPLALLGTIVVVALGLSAGSSGFGWADSQIVWQIRLPRVLSGFGAGAALDWRAR